MRKLPVFRSVREVLSGVTRHYFQLLAAAWPAIFILIAASGVTVWNYYSSGYFEAAMTVQDQSDIAQLEALQREIYSGANGFLILLMTLISAVASAVAAVRWHRLVLLGEGTSGSRRNIKFVRVEDGAYIGAVIKIALVAIVALLLIGALVAVPVMLLGAENIQGILSLVIAVLAVAAYFWLISLFMRLMLALPDASVGQGGRLRAVFKASAGNGWRMLGLALLLGVVTIIGLMVVLFLLGLAIGLLHRADDGVSIVAIIGGVVVYIAAYLYFLMTQVTMLSVAYREIIGSPPVEGLGTLVEPV
jgi:hypothetical protein